MDCIILAAGYATRMYPLTYEYPKALLEMNDKPFLSYLVENVRNCVDHITVVTNHKFYDRFEAWSADYPTIELIDDGTVSNDTRLGALGDLQLAVTPGHDYLVMASDNFINFSLSLFIDYYDKVKTSCIMYQEIHDLSRLRRTAVIELYYDTVTSFVEKPVHPHSNHAVPPFYIYTANDIARLPEALQDRCNSDLLGSFAEWLYNKSTLHAFKMPRTCIDIADLMY